MSIFEIISKYKDAFISGLTVTLGLCLLIWLFGMLFGGILGVLSSRNKKVNSVIKTVNFLLSGIPVLVMLFWFHYPLQAILKIVINPFITTVFTLALINIFSVANIVSNNLLEIPSQYKDVAKVCNIQPRAIFCKIEFPMMFKMSLPSILSLQVNMMHLTLFGSLISVEEIFRICQQVNSQIYQPVEVYSALAIFFLCICLPLNGIAVYLKRKVNFNFIEK